MKKASELNPKMYQELIDRVKTGQPLDDLLSQYDPHALRDILEEATAEASGNTHPFDLYEKPELFKNVKIKVDPNLKNHGEIDYVLEKQTGIQRPDKGLGINLKNRGDKGTLLHESQHAYDILSRPETSIPVEKFGPGMLSDIKEKLDINRKISSSSDLKGLEEGTEYLSKHFKPDIEDKFGKLKQMLNLERIVKGQPLKMIAPLMKAAGVGAIGAAAMGIGNKAMAGEYGQAGLDTADLATDLTPIVGEAKMAIYPTELGNAELPPEEMQERERFNKMRQRLLNK